MKPLIAVNLDIEGENPKVAKIQSLYFEAVIKAGGIPLMLPPISDEDLKELLAVIDGFLFIGGDDYCPSLYGEEPHASVELAHRDRVDFDFRLLRAVLAADKLPMLGICAGAQILNICLGGSLYQDIPSEFPGSSVSHSSPDGWQKGFEKHKVILRPGSKLEKIYGRNEFDVPTSHHQAVKKLGEGLIAAAGAEDGVVEAVEMEISDFVIGVQWHPERDFAGNSNLFEAFIKAAAARRARIAAKELVS